MTELGECLCYDAESGALRWRTRPKEHFADARAWKTWNTRFAGKVVGGPDRHGYLYFEFRGKRLAVARVAWLLTFGRWPTPEIDHRNGVPNDNRLCNLREATRAENCQNTVTDNANGAGVTSSRGKWAAGIKVDRHRYFLGRFTSIGEARSAYVEAKRRLHPFQPISRE